MGESPRRKRISKRSNSAASLFIEPRRDTSPRARRAKDAWRNHKTFSPPHSTSSRTMAPRRQTHRHHRGGTREAIDPVRVISNHSSGKMGYALAERSALAWRSGFPHHQCRRLARALWRPSHRIISTATYAMPSCRNARRRRPSSWRLPPLIFAPPSADQKIKKEDYGRTHHPTRPKSGHSRRGRQRPCRIDPPTLPASSSVSPPRPTTSFKIAHGKLERKKLDMIVANPVPQTFGSDNVKAIHPLKKSRRARPCPHDQRRPGLHHPRPAVRKLAADKKRVGRLTWLSAASFIIKNHHASRRRYSR